MANDTAKQNIHYTCIACITIDSVMKTDKKNDPQVYLIKLKNWNLILIMILIKILLLINVWGFIKILQIYG